MRARKAVNASLAAVLAAFVGLAGIPAYATEASSPQQWREGGGIVYPYGKDLSKVADNGVATYVGGNFNTFESVKYGNNGEKDAIKKSRAAEVEGLTVVDGLVNLGTDHDGGWYWGGHDFRFGAAGLGSGYSPERGNTVLAVGGVACATSVISNTGSSAFFSASRSDNVEYIAQVAGSEKGCNEDMRSTLHANADGTRRDWIQYQEEPLKNVNGRDYSGYSETVKSQSSRLSGLKDTGIVEYGVAPADTDYWRTNYRAENVSYKFVFEGEDGNHQFAEKLVTFKGDNKSSVQVFTVDAEKLNTEGWHGVSFKFEGIPADAAVVVNVKGDVVRFDNGWRFWWNGTEIGNAWGKGVDAAVPAAFKNAASSIMWNFPDAENVTIQGGRLNNGDDRDGLLTPTDDRWQPKVRWGDPSAEFIGSILVPNGNLKTEVSTNGRVSTGGDYTMASGTNTDSASTSNNVYYYSTRPSVMQMDQERHNFPWIGCMHLDAVDVAWKKSDDKGNLLKGSRWQVYSTLKDAENHTNPLLSVTDNDNTDLDKQEGSIAVGNLEPGYDYFVREILAPQGHNLSEHIYVAVPDTGKLAGIGAAAGANILNGDTVKNGKTTEVGWVKYDGSKQAGDETAMLKGSEWSLNGNAVKDSTEEPKTVTVSRKGENVDTLTLFRGESAQLYANVAPENAPKSVTWESGNGSVATVDGGLVTAGDPGETVVKVASKANPGVFNEVKVTVVGEFDIKNGEEVYKNGGTYAVVKGNHNLSLTVDADRLPYMTSSDVNVAKVKNGVLQALNPGTTRLSYTANGKERSFLVTVVPENTTAVFFANRHGNNIYKANPGESTGEIMCHDERKPVCTPEITEVKYEDNIIEGQVTAESPDWSVVYVPNEGLKAFDYVVGASVGRYHWESNGADMQSVEIKAMRGPDHSNFHAPEGVIAVWMENWDRSGVGIPAELKPSRSGDVRVTDADGNRVYSGVSRVLDTGSEVKYNAQVVKGTSDSDSRVYWKSSAPDVVSVSSDGKLQAKKAGIADVYAITPKGSSQWLQFHVVDPGMVAVYADPDSNQTYANCTEDDPCGVRDSSDGYKTWYPYSNDGVVSEDDWDSRDKVVLTNGVDTKYRVNGRTVKRIDVPVEAIKGLRDKPSGTYNGVNYWNTYLVSRKNEIVHCSTVASNSNFNNCTRDTGGSFRSERSLNRYGFGNLFGGYDYFTYYEGDRIILDNYNYLYSNYKTEALPTVESLPGLTDEEKATLPDQDTDLEDAALNLPKQVNPQWEDTDARPGVFRLGNVADGDYTLEETTAPAGYTLLGSPVTLKVKGNQVFWKEGIPVVENVAWIANTKTGVPDTSGTSSNHTPNTPQQGIPSKPGQPSTPQASEDTPKKTVKMGKTGTSVAGMVALAFMCLLGGYGALQYRRYYWKR